MTTLKELKESALKAAVSMVTQHSDAAANAPRNKSKLSTMNMPVKLSPELQKRADAIKKRFK